MGNVNDLIGGLLGYLRDPRRTQQMQGLAGLLESTGIPQTVERIAYGQPITNINKANVPLLMPETANAALTLLPIPSGANKAAMAVGRAGEQYAERIVPQVMERGGLGAQLLQDLSMGSRSQMVDQPTDAINLLSGKKENTIVGLLSKQSEDASPKVNPSELKAREAIDNLVKQTKYFGVDSPLEMGNMPLGIYMSHLNEYLGQSKAVADLPESAKSSLRNLWQKAEDATLAYQRIHGENKTMGKMPEAANKERFSTLPPWFDQELEDKFQNKQISRAKYERQALKNMENYFKNMN